MYNITEYSYKQAEKLGVKIKPSTNKKKKIDVFKSTFDKGGAKIEKKIASIGSITNKDYPTYIREKGKEYADERRRLYRLRHKKDLNNKDGNGYWANKILW